MEANSAEQGYPRGRVVRPRALRPGGRLTGDDVAQLLGSWGPAVMAELRRTRLWRGGAANELEGAYWNAAMALSRRDFESEEHLRRALYRGMNYRALTFWRAARARAQSEIPVDISSLETEDERSPQAQEQAEIAADFRVVLDFMSELDASERDVWKLTVGGGLSQRETAERLGLTALEVKRHLYRVGHKLDRFAMVIASGRLCGKRARPISALAAVRATPQEATQARAHLERCPRCAAVYRHQKSLMTRGAGALLPMPVMHNRGGWTDRLSSSTEDAVVRVKHQLFAFIGHGASGGSAEPILAGLATGGAAVGAKLAVGMCTTALAAGGVTACTIPLENGRASQAPHVSSAPVRRVRAPHRSVSITEATQQPAKHVASTSHQRARRSTKSPAPTSERSSPLTTHPARLAAASRRTTAGTVAPRPSSDSQREFSWEAEGLPRTKHPGPSPRPLDDQFGRVRVRRLVPVSRGPGAKRPRLLRSSKSRTLAGRLTRVASRRKH
ncbi:MAG: sigma-70 family RNA polymerase sigma factor [Actinomycetota bacterium]|nr:sigma-70 family RNA polymerase sigma factor [Actinomycetota bacterium]